MKPKPSALLIATLLILATGCFTPRPIRGGRFTITPKQIPGVEQTVIVGNELLILGAVTFTVAAWFLAHRHGLLRGAVDARKTAK